MLPQRRTIVSGAIASGIISSVGASTLNALTLPKRRPWQPNLPAAEPATPEFTVDSAVSMAWIGHSTVLINVHGTMILTDPVLFNNIGVRIFGATFGPRRITRPALDPSDIPVPDIVLLSHAHMDHMDLASLEYLTNRSPGKIHAITAKNTSDVIDYMEWKSLREIDWGESVEVGGVRIGAFPVRHFGWRLPGEPDRAKGQRKTGRSFNSYLIEEKEQNTWERSIGCDKVHRVLFGGDTAYTESFKDLKFINGIDVAIMPIGAYNPWKAVHCNPEEAVMMARDMQASAIVPIHCMTFPLGREGFHEPRARLVKAVRSDSDLTLGYSQIGQLLKVA